MSLVLEMYEVLDNDEHTQEGWLRPERLSFAPISGRYISYALYCTIFQDFSILSESCQVAYALPDTVRVAPSLNVTDVTYQYV